MLVKFLLRLDREPAHRPEVQSFRQAQVFVMLIARDLLALALDIAVLLRLDFDLLGNLGIGNAGAGAGQRHQLCIAHVGAAQQLG